METQSENTELTNAERAYLYTVIMQNKPVNEATLWFQRMVGKLANILIFVGICFAVALILILYVIS